MNIQEKILRNAVLCQAIEPLGNKLNCTTRYVDSSAGTKLDYFIVSAANSSFHINGFIERLMESKEQPSCIFDFTYLSLKASIRNRLGIRGNFAQLLMLTPVIAAQIILQKRMKTQPSVIDIAKHTENVLKNTTSEDVDYLQMFSDLATDISVAHHKRNDTAKEQPVRNFKGQYENIWECLDENNFEVASELKSGYEYTVFAFDIMKQHLEKGVIAASEEAYKIVYASLGRHDVAADMIVMAMYFILDQYEEDALFV